MIKTLNGGNGKRMLDIETVVRERYAKGAEEKQESLCCPVTYDPKYLKAIPKEILEKDYGCGDPSRYIRQGDVVLDLGSGAGKICYIASQIVGPKGRVIGVDFNPAMLRLARKYQREVGERIGWHNVGFCWGKIQDLQTDLIAVEEALSKRPIATMDDFFQFEDVHRSIRQGKKLIEDESIDVIVSNCVLNLVRTEDKEQLFREMHRVLKKGGRVALSDIVSDEEVPEDLKQDPELWSGCVSGAFTEKAMIEALERNGFYGICLDKFDAKPWKTVRGIEFRSVTVTATKGKEGPCWERNQAVMYKGPWKQVTDDDKHVLKRGVRTAVCDKTFQIYSKEPYRADMILIEPRKEVPISKAKAFDCARGVERHPKETKGHAYSDTSTPQTNCLDGGCC